MQPNTVTLPLDLVNAIYALLDQMPHGQVRRLIAGLEQAVQQQTTQSIPSQTDPKTD